MFGTLYRYELKKILTRPYILLLLLAMVGVTIFLNVKPLLAQEEVAYAEEDGSPAMRPSSWSAVFPRRTPGACWTMRRPWKCGS